MESETSVDYERTRELKEFDDTKEGVKGLVDAGILNIPKIFIRPPEDLAADEPVSGLRNIEVPIIDIGGIDDGIRRKEIVNEVRIASGEWGFFQVMNHGIPLSVFDEMIDGIRLFHEQDSASKKEVYTREFTKNVKFNSNFDLYASKSADWRDTLTLSYLNSDPDPSDIPQVCRRSTIEYVKRIRRLGETLFELLSEALGLESDHLSSIGSCSGCTVVCHYYPACPQPELTLGARKHTDPGTLTLLLQNHISGLQVLREGQWFDVNPIQGGLVVNMGDFLQILSNDKFKSVEHRVIANHVGPRITVGCFFSGDGRVYDKSFGPMKELISEANPPRYKEFSLREYHAKFLSSSLDQPPIFYYRL